ncbi:MAG: hypothetical protein WD030_01165, partial [Pirellulales bacterium]
MPPDGTRKRVASPDDRRLRFFPPAQPGTDVLCVCVYVSANDCAEEKVFSKFTGNAAENPA